jgi:hypothetical protein
MAAPGDPMLFGQMSPHSVLFQQQFQPGQIVPYQGGTPQTFTILPPPTEPGLPEKYLSQALADVHHDKNVGPLALGILIALGLAHPSGSGLTDDGRAKLSALILKAASP